MFKTRIFMTFKKAVTLRSSKLILINDDTSFNESVLIKLLLDSSKKGLPKMAKVRTCRAELPSLPEGKIPDTGMLQVKPYFIRVTELNQMYKDSHSGNSFRPEKYKKHRNI